MVFMVLWYCAIMKLIWHYDFLKLYFLFVILFFILLLTGPAFADKSEGVVGVGRKRCGRRPGGENF